MFSKINKNRIFEIKSGALQPRPVVYWMSRDQRVSDNWSLIYAQNRALTLKVPLFVVFCLVSDFLGATIRHYGFMLRGLQQVKEKLKLKNIPFFLLNGNPSIKIPEFLSEVKAGLLVTDFDPLKIKKAWKNEIAKKIKIPFHEVDAHNIVPVRLVSTKQEYGAYTIRPKISRLLGDFLTEFPAVEKHPFNAKEYITTLEPEDYISLINVDRRVPEVSWLKPGEKEAKRILDDFINSRLNDYTVKRNDPTLNLQSNLSPYLHFGQISAQRVALAVMSADVREDSKMAFLEELIVRKELSDNFCYYNEYYDKFSGFPEWARKSLEKHKKDKRDYIYSLEAFEYAKTHDPLWNAAQIEMVKKGKMHGYMRMYWAKKILEWSQTPEDALAIAIYLNDRYELDGRDSNGYTGIAWSIGGVHDRAWAERKIFGKIRYMSFKGCQSKFDVEGYINKMTEIVRQNF